jgi:hypothetical protein
LDLVASVSKGRNITASLDAVHQLKLSPNHKITCSLTHEMFRSRHLAKRQTWRSLDDTRGKNAFGRKKEIKINQGARMQKFIAILIGCSLTLAISVRAEQVDQADVKKKSVQKSKPVLKQQFTPKQHAVTNTHIPEIHNTVRSTPTVRSQPTVRSTTLRSNAKIHDSNVSKEKLHTLPAVQSNKLPVVKSNKLLPTVQSNKINRQTVKNIRSQHLNFHAKPNPKITSAKFNQNYRIAAAQNWNGSQYNAFRSYQSQWHDQGWWRSHHNNLLLIGGGWYFWDAGYWYPAWGYDNSAAYYPYDGPIYSGPRARPLDQVVADVQSSLQEQGYYQGEVDGLLGPLTREALAAYQSAQGIEPTAAIDQPTLDSLGLG